jgi:tetratricopeptide (TPR) repeat protein
MRSGKQAVLLAVLVWTLAAAMGPVCYGGEKDTAPSAAAPDLSALARRARPAVGVLVTFDAKGEPLAQGTAFFVRANGVALTCRHVLEGATSALVRMENGAFFPVEGKLAADPVRDLALLKVAGKDLPTLSLGDSSTLAAGQRVVAVTSPEGLENTVADGLVSAVRELPSGSVVQVSVPLSSGSSGGPLFDLSGKVVAVAAAVLTEGQALNFAIPINAAKPLLAHPGKLTALAPAKEPADLEDWLRERPPSAQGAGAYDLWLQGMRANFDERYGEAVTHLRAALALDPSHYQAHCCLGSTYGELGRHQEEIAEYKQAIRLKPDDADAHNNLGVAYGNLGRYQEEIAEYREAIRLKPDYALAHLNLGVAYDKLGRYQEEIAEYREAIRLKPAFALAHYNLGLAYGKLDRNQEAVEAFKQAIRLKPDYAEAHYNLGVAYGELGRWQEAAEAFKQAIRLKPDFAEAHSNLGAAYVHLGRHQEAAEAFKQAIRLKPDDALPHYNLGLAYRKLGRHQEALEAFKQAIRLKPDDALAHYNLGLAYLAFGDRGAALDEYNILKTLDADLAGKLFRLIYP